MELLYQIGRRIYYYGIHFLSLFFYFLVGIANCFAGRFYESLYSSKDLLLFFLSFFSFFALFVFTYYMQYVNNYNFALGTVSLVKHVEKVANVLAKCHKDGRCLGQDLGAFLILPIQRIPVCLFSYY